jgi:PAS domain S-box-containing protein
MSRLTAVFSRMTERVAEAYSQLGPEGHQRRIGLAQAGELLAQRGRDLEEAREELDRFFSLALDLLCIADAKGQFVRVNPAWQSVLGWSAEELVAVPYDTFVHPDDRAATVAETRKLASGGSTVNFENRYRHRDGSYRWLNWTAVAHRERGLIYAAARDVTAEKQMARERDRHVEALDALNRELEAFSYSVSHDLRAPLRHITGFAGLLTRSTGGSLDAESQRYLRVIVEAAVRMGQLIDDLLAFSRVGRTPLRRVVADLNRIVHEVRDEAMREAPGRAIEWTLDDLPSVEGDATLLRVVFMNLLSNAVKYTGTRPTARIHVGVASIRHDETTIFVRDNGVGFDMRYADKLFGTFQRLHSSDDFEGTGIGLATVRRIVQRHGGRVWAEGRVDAGATFYVSIPAEEQAVG